MKQIIFTIILFISLFLVAYGGFTDMVSHNWEITSQHAWSDGIYLLLLLILALMIRGHHGVLSK